MRTVVVYESMFGNTHAIAEAIAEGLRPTGEVIVVAVGAADPELIGAADLVVVGGPTHARGMTRPGTRDGAREQSRLPRASVHLDPAAVEPGPGVREWLEKLPKRGGQRAAAFDTRVNFPAIISGRASQGIANGLRAHGFELIAPPESFLVDKDSTLVTGEQGRAVEWGTTLAGQLVPVA